jgi:hypothetical protein
MTFLNWQLVSLFVDQNVKSFGCRDFCSSLAKTNSIINDFIPMHHCTSSLGALINNVTLPRRRRAAAGSPLHA